MLTCTNAGLLLLTICYLANSSRAAPLLQARAPSICSNESSVVATAQYHGSKYSNGNTTRLRIANGGAGQSGFVGALATAFIDYSRESGLAKEDYVVDWILSDTTASINHIANGEADIAITYSPPAEYLALNTSIASQRIYAFRDHFYFMGPPSNPAKMDTNDTILDMFDKLVTSGNAGNTVPPTRFLSRYDKSATNIKDSELFIMTGQVPWASPVSTWYHQYEAFPAGALIAASLLNEYTLTDRGTYLNVQSMNASIIAQTTLYKRGEDVDPHDLLLNPASALLGSKVCEANLALAKGFMTWMTSATGGQAVAASFKEPGHSEVLYSRAPNCTVTPKACYGW